MSLSVIVQASEWVSPIDLKYKLKAPQLYEKYVEARSYIDTYTGQQTNLVYADEILREILSQDPNFAPVYREYGRVYILLGYVNSVGNISNFEVGSLGLAEQTILKSIEIEPDYADSYVLLGHLYTSMNIYAQAEKSLRKAEKIGTKIPWLDLNWADLLMNQGQFDAALIRFNRIIDRRVSNKKAFAHALRGVTRYYETVSDNENAKKAYLKHIEYEPQLAWNWGNYASFLLFDYGDVDGSIKNAEKALSIMNYGNGRFTLASALFTKWAIEAEKNGITANVYFDKAMALYPNIDQIIATTLTYKSTYITGKKLIEYKSGLSSNK